MNGRTSSQLIIARFGSYVAIVDEATIDVQPLGPSLAIAEVI